MWDEILLAYADRSRILPEAYRPHVIRRNGDVLPTVLVDGQVAGVWRVINGVIEIGAFTSSPRRRGGPSPRGARPGDVPRRSDPCVYQRYNHWWDDLPESEVRRLARVDGS